MTNATDIDARTARIAALRGQRPPLTDLIQTGSSNSGSAYKHAPRTRLIGATLGLALLVGAIGWNWQTLAAHLPTENSGVHMTLLEVSQ